MITTMSDNMGGDTGATGGRGTASTAATAGTETRRKFGAGKILAGAALALTLGAIAQPASAHVSWSIGIGVPPVVVGAPAYYAPPVYLTQPPAYYAPPPVVYRPRPIYYEPAPVYYRAPPRYYAPAPVYSPRGYWDHGVYYRR